MNARRMFRKNFGTELDLLSITHAKINHQPKLHTFFFSQPPMMALIYGLPTYNFVPIILSSLFRHRLI